MGGGEVFVCRLDDNDSNFYLDGSPADLTGQEGDVMVVFLEFWCIYFYFIFEKCVPYGIG